MWVLGLLQIVVYFLVFTFLIKKFNYHTPGREEKILGEGESAAAPAEKVTAKAETGSDELAMNIIQGLGGKQNIKTVENCITRLRVSLADPSLLNEELINKSDNRGIVKKGNDVQIIYGLHVAEVRQAVEDQLAKL